MAVRAGGEGACTPSMECMEVRAALEHCGGAARRPALLRLGVDDAALRRATRAGVLQPVRGLYALPTAPPGLIALLRNREVLTCVSAAPHFALWSLPTAGGLHVHHRREDMVAGNSIHHAGLVLRVQTTAPVASLPDVLIHALRCLPFAESLVMVECAVIRGDVSLDFLRMKLPGKRNGAGW